MHKLDWIYGFLLGIISSIIGSYLFITVFTHYDFMRGLTILRSEGILGGLIKLGALLNLGVFFVLLYFKKDTMAKGVIVATVFLGILAFFV
jgi:hypothetical protein